MKCKDCPNSVTCTIRHIREDLETKGLKTICTSVDEPDKEYKNLMEEVPGFHRGES